MSDDDGQLTRFKTMSGLQWLKIKKPLIDSIPLLEIAYDENIDKLELTRRNYKMYWDNIA